MPRRIARTTKSGGRGGAEEPTLGMPITIPRIFSGGQTGADRGALEWAIRRDVPYGGWCPKGRRAEDGTIPAKFQLIETPSAEYRQRTEWNVRHSDATVIFTQTALLEGGSKLTARFAAKHGKPCLHLPITADAANVLTTFLAEHQPKVLNIAGQRGSKAPELSAMVGAVLDEVFFLPSRG